MARLPKGQDFSVYSSPSFEFWYEEKWYTVQGAQTMARVGTPDDMSTMRSEYTRMRDTAQKRLKRLEKSFPKSKVLQRYPKGFPKLKDIDPRDFPKAFSELAKFLRAKRSTVTGQRQIREKTINTWQKNGVNLNQKNYDRVIDMLEESRARNVVYDSDKMVESVEATLELSDEQFNTLLDRLEQVVSHSDKLVDSLEHYMKENDIEDYQKVNIDDFIEKMGW